MPETTYNVIAPEKGVPISQAHRLQGSTKEEIAKDADAFLKDYRGGNGGGQLDGGARRSAPGKDDDVEKELAALTTQAKTSKDPYFLALVGNGLILDNELRRGATREA